MFGMTDCNSGEVPMIPGIDLSSPEGDFIDETLYRSLVGKLLMPPTTPDLTSATLLTFCLVTSTSQESLILKLQNVFYDS